MSKKKTDLDLEWEQRTLCSDGNCIGVIGPGGNCKECGKPYDGELPETDAFKKSDSDSSEMENTAAGSEAEDAVTEDTEDAVTEDTEDFNEEWENRRLCSDGNCIGVIGPDGNCKECGKPFEG